MTGVRTVRVDGENLTLDEIIAAARSEARLELAGGALERIDRSRRHVETMVAEDRVVYGVTTGLGDLANVVIDAKDAQRLQHNLLASHACGTGPLAEPDVVRAMLLLRANALAKGASGVRAELIERLLRTLELDLVPAVPTQGSVGSSGDLVPLAHLARAVTGEGELVVDGARVPAGPVLAQHGLDPLTLEAKEGLALINGTQFQGALGALLAHDARRLVATACLVAAMSIEGVRASRWPFDARLVALRPHPGAVSVAATMETLLADSSIMRSHEHCDKVQDPYSFRCIPQVHGAVLDAIAHLAVIVEREANSATDNPLFVGDEPLAISGGNFHGEPLGLPISYVGTALAKLGAMSERRTVHLLMGEDEDLGAFLATEQGVDSGLMIAQYVSASLVNENKALAYPVVADTVPTSGNQEDLNAMGATQARHARTILDNVAKVLAIEAICAAQAMDLHEPLTSSAAVEAAQQALRDRVPALSGDRYLAPDIEAAVELVRSGELLAVAENEAGPLLA